MLQATETEQYFDRHACRYDELIETAAFQLDDAYEYLARYIRHAVPAKSPRILELGIGTGRLAQRVLQENSGATVTGVDASARMLDKAAQNLAGYRNRLSLIHGEFPAAIPEGEYDCVVSAIAISFYTIDHSALFRKVHKALQQGGLFTYTVNVAQNALSVDRSLIQMLRNEMKITDEQRSWLKSIKERVDLYQVPADWHGTALRQGGFVDVDCIYLRYKLASFSGTKPRVAI